MRKAIKVQGWMVLLAAFLGVGVLGAIQGSRIGGDIAWAASLEAGSKEANQSRKPMMLSFHTPGCGWCKKLDAETFSDPRVVDTARRFVCVRLESDVDSAAVERYRVEEYPMTIFVDASGKELVRVPGYVPADRFAQALNVILQETSKSR